MSLWYVYPIWHRVSFTLIAKKHLEYMKKKARVEEIDELAFPHILPHSRPLVFIQPFFYVMLRSSRFISRRLHAYRGFIGIDVADSDRISNLAVSMTDYVEVMVVPSSFAKEAYIKSGATCRVEVVPHGLDDYWFTDPPRLTQSFPDLFNLKRQRRLKFLLFFLWHSDYRKGADLVYNFYRELKKERKDVVLIFKTATADGHWAKKFKELSCIHVYGWLTEEQKMELYDLSDIYLLFSRGGGFELNGLEALVRGCFVIAPNRGSWVDYLDRMHLVNSHSCSYVLKDNPIHCGKGVEVDIERAIDRVHVVLDNLDDFKAKQREFVMKRVYPNFRWEVVADRLLEIAKAIYERQRGVVAHVV
ncbi:MAG: hypothetical protein DRJ60_00425 [Thermoprotei archaeon]|nr:MAG: hypothetical protein DRJ60_00425 [Thermoprotei archaeon]